MELGRPVRRRLDFQGELARGRLDSLSLEAGAPRAEETGPLVFKGPRAPGVAGAAHVHGLTQRTRLHLPLFAGR